jgi:S-DNA-T family DNA segregation ATPase FtsK/SpoIIIE
VLALLFGASFLSYHPEDPSFLLESTREAGPRNWIGPVGAQLAAVAFGFLGVSALLVPWLLAVAAWRRFHKLASRRVVGRGLGGLLVVLTLPGLLQLVLGRIAWRGVEIPVGGGLGAFLASSLEGAMGVAGALFVLLGLVVIGFTLLVQSTLGELLAAWRQRIVGGFEQMALGWSRRRERKHKDQARRRVLSKHLERSRKEREAVEPEAPAIGGARVDLPLRVVERAGKGGFSVRRVSGEVPAVEGASEALPGKPQQEIPFDRAAREAGPLPPVNLLSVEGLTSSVDESELVRMGEVIRARCAEFGVEGTVEGISPGPVITVFEFQPAPGVKVSQIVNLQDDLALALKAESVRIDRIAGRSTLGIEVPNRDRSLIRLGNLLSRERFKRSPSVLTLALGTDIRGEPIYADLATMPHLLVAGATGAGKSVGLQSMITSILYKARRDEVQFIFIDPKRIELGVYADIPHLKAEVVVEPRKAANALRWAVAEMERRYRLLAELHVRGIEFYNRAIADPKVRKRLALSDTETIGDQDLKPLPYYVVVIDELADLMMVASAEVETSIARLAQMARAVGIHLIVATQRPSVDILTGTIKANFPCRIAFATASRHDSRTILDQVGSEKLLGKGDMLLMPQGTSRLQRLHGAYISEQETAALVRWLKKTGQPDLDPQVLAPPPEAERAGGSGGDNDDDLFDEAARLVVAEQQASASFLQRRLRVGFSRAGRLIDIMEREGLLGPSQGSKPREVLVKRDYFEELDRSRT